MFFIQRPSDVSLLEQTQRSMLLCSASLPASKDTKTGNHTDFVADTRSPGMQTGHGVN